jgi:carbon-monoxide dehydrogenase medium subunit
MIPARFDYEVAESAEHALELLASREDAKLLAGGHSLISAMKLRIARPELLVDIGRISSLAYVRDAGESLAIGALTRHKAVRDDLLVQEHCPIVSHTAGLIGDPQVRHRGTIGGSLVHGDPASDLPAVMLALEAEFVIVGSEGERTVPAAEFFRGVFDTAVGPGELLTEIRVPKLVGSMGWSYLKFNRRAQDWATVGVAALVRRDNGGVGEARIALTNMGATPVRATTAEQALVAGEPDPAAHVADGTDPASDVSASAEFRSHLARVMGKRAIEEALSR